MHKVPGYHPKNHPYIFAHQPFGIDLINVQTLTIQTMINCKELTNGRVHSFPTRNSEDLKTLQIIYIEQLSASKAQFVMASCKVE